MGPTELDALHRRLGVAGAHDIDRIGRLIQEARFGELADIGHRTALGKQLADCWRDYTRPTGYISVRDLAGYTLLLSAMQREKLLPGGSDWAPMLSHRPAWKYLAADLAHGWAAADAVEPDGIELRLPWIVVLMPSGITVAPDTELVALAIGMRKAPDEIGGIELCWSGITNNIGIVGQDKPWHREPDQSIPSRLAWGVAAMLSSEPLEIHVDPVDVPQGLIRNRSQRPAAQWILPPVRRVANIPWSRSDGPAKGTVTPHWRAGHRRKQRYGPKLAKWRWIYIAPIWVCPHHLVDGEDLAA